MLLLHTSISLCCILLRVKYSKKKEKYSLSKGSITHDFYLIIWITYQPSLKTTMDKMPHGKQYESQLR